MSEKRKDHHVKTMIELADAERLIEKLYTLLDNYKKQKNSEKQSIDHAFLKDEDG